MGSASRIVERRWAITIAVRPARASASAACTAASDVESRWAVASSRITTRGRASSMPGDGEALALAAGEPVAPLADHGVQAVGQRRDRAAPAGPCASASHSSSSVASGRAKRRFSRTVSWNRWPSWVTSPSVSRIGVEREVADVDAGRAAPRRRRRRRAAAPARRSSTCRCPTSRRGRPAGRARPGTTRRGAPRRRPARRGWPPPPARPATPCRPTGRRSGRRRTPPRPALGHVAWRRASR